MDIARMLSGKRWANVALGLLALAPTIVFPQTKEERFPEQVQRIVAAAEAARETGNTQEERGILEQGLETVGATSPAAYPIFQLLGQHHADRGNLNRAAEIAERQLLIARTPGQEHMALIKLVSLYAQLRQENALAVALEKLDQLQPRLRSARNWQRFGQLWQAGTAWAKANQHISKGHLANAEEAWKSCLSSVENVLREAPDETGALFYVADCTAGLIRVQIATGQLAAAGAVADHQRVVIERLTQAAKRPSVMIRFAPVFGRLAVEQGRLDDARRLYTEALSAIQASNAADTSLRAANLRVQLAMLEMLQQRWDKALEWHQQREDALRRAGTERGRVGFYSMEYAYTLMRLGRVTEAVEMLNKIVAAQREHYDEHSLYRWEGMAFRGVALAAVGRRDEALRDLSIAIPKVLDLAKGERSSAESGVLRTARLNWLLEGYLSLLADYASGAATGDAAAAMDEAFRMADLARGSTVQRALAASASRATISDPALADRARREQDLQLEISALADSLDDLLARGRIADQDPAVADMRANLAGLRSEHAKAQAEIERRFPDYATLLNPRPVGIADVQKLLKPNEALVSFYVASGRTLIWAIPANAPPRFAVAPVGREQLDREVATLRLTLDPNAEAGDKLPKFDFILAHELYAQLLAPVEAGWKGAQALIVVPHGGLGQLPFGVLTTQAWTASAAKPPYSEMAEAPWLLKQVAISQLPSVIALPVLRARGQRAPAKLPFIGFGDPLFSASAVVATQTTHSLKRRDRVAPAIPSAASSAVPPELGQRINFKLLPALPDTALEIEDVAGMFAADRQRDVFLQRRATETAVKTTDLSNYRIVMFATHGLMNGEMPGLYQPALALSNPELTGDKEDGMLTTEEILGLKLRADWVVLSACNSGAAGNQSGESISGLGRAFFYAGAKSLLVTHWAVETESARMLTTETLRRQIADSGLSRVQALQQSAMALMKKSAGDDYSYAHPMFWAPYVLVGDGS